MLCRASYPLSPHFVGSGIADLPASVEVVMPRRKGSAVAIINKADIIKRIEKGEPLTKIAQSLGYANHSGITERIGDDPDYKVALRTGIIAKIEKREAELETADDNVSVTRADRLLGHARWWAERLDPSRFAPKQQVERTSQPVINFVFAGNALQHPPIIEGEIVK